MRGPACMDQQGAEMQPYLYIGCSHTDLMHAHLDASRHGASAGHYVTGHVTPCNTKIYLNKAAKVRLKVGALAQLIYPRG